MTARDAMVHPHDCPNFRKDLPWRAKLGGKKHGAINRPRRANNPNPYSGQNVGTGYCLAFS